MSAQRIDLGVLLVATVFAADLSWECLPYAKPADWLPYAEATAGGGIDTVAEAAVLAEIDDEMWYDCTGEYPDYSGSMCVDGVSAAGTAILVQLLGEYCDTDGDGTNCSRSSYYLAERPAAGAGWSRVELSIAESWQEESWRDWVAVSWKGELEATLPMDIDVVFTNFGEGRGAGAGWDDGTCRWSAHESLNDQFQSYWRVDVGAQGLVVDGWDIPSCACCQLAAYLDGVPMGPVDQNWEFLPDADGDFLEDEQDCAPEDPAFNLCAEDIPCDGLDHDCSGSDENMIDADRDGFRTDCSGGGEDCDDGQAETFPGANETAGDGIDQDCDGHDDTDADGDGWTADGDDREPDCDDFDRSINPDALEVWDDGVDQNCVGGDATRAGGAEDEEGERGRDTGCAGSPLLGLFAFAAFSGANLSRPHR